MQKNLKTLHLKIANLIEEIQMLQGNIKTEIDDGLR